MYCNSYRVTIHIDCALCFFDLYHCNNFVISQQAASPDVAVEQLSKSSKEVDEIIYFLLGAMTIVEIVDAHEGFKLVGGITFAVSSVLDSLTSTILMVSLLQKFVFDTEQRRSLGAVVVIAANAGGAWTPIGDITTTMLWIDGRISTLRTMQMAPLTSKEMAPQGKLVFCVGIGTLLFVPVFKSLTGLPPYLGMLFGLGVLWILTDAIHFDDSQHQNLKVPRALSRVDTQSVLFFLGILLSMGSLKSAGILHELAAYLDAHIPRIELKAASIGIASAFLDNVPLVAATMGMYSISTFPIDSKLWQLVAYCAGTGGSLLIIGSAAGIAFMGMEKDANFFWYFKKVSAFALAAYAAGFITYLAVNDTLGF
ncbi:hypothetical protein O6H91_Y372300 [Diphasiastrum complanatum]|nr:hypothetical protein O6H91_Y372300 [Diphasiastrum complanatum]